MHVPFKIMSMLDKLGNTIRKEEHAGADLTKTVISVSCDDFKILYVPRGAEKNAIAELNG